MGQAVQNQNLNKLLMRLAIYFLFLLANNLVNAQVYTKKQTRHRFAQLNIGLGFQTNLGGSTKYLDARENVQTLILSNSYSPRFLIGGTHFWGHADFYIGIPLFHTIDYLSQ